MSQAKYTTQLSHSVFLACNQGFFLGDWEGPPGGKNFAHPPQPTAVPAFLTRACSLNWVLSLKISKISTHFSLNFVYFLAQNCIRKLYFMLKTPKFALILLGGYFGLQQTIFPSPLSSDSITDASSPPPIWLGPRWGPKIVPKSKSPLTKTFVKKPWPSWDTVIADRLAMIYRKIEQMFLVVWNGKNYAHALI